MAAAVHHGLTLPQGAVAGIKGGWLTVVHTYPSEMAQNFWTAIWAFLVCFIATILISLVTRPRKERSWLDWSTRLLKSHRKGNWPGTCGRRRWASWSWRWQWL